MAEAHNNIGTEENSNSPKHFMVLDAVSRGMDDIGKIAKVTKLDKAVVELAINDLAAQRLVLAFPKKRGLFGRRELQVSMTETGTRLLEEKKKQLEKKASGLRSSYRNGDRQAAQSLVDENRAWLPMMIFSGLMSAVMFASIMSFAGMAMNPAESAMASDASAGSQEASADSGAGESPHEGADGGGADFGTVSDTSGGSGGADAGFDAAGGGDLSGDVDF